MITEQCFCQSYYDSNDLLQGCTCGKCVMLSERKIQQAKLIHNLDLLIISTRYLPDSFVDSYDEMFDLWCKESNTMNFYKWLRSLEGDKTKKKCPRCQKTLSEEENVVVDSYNPFEPDGHYQEKVEPFLWCDECQQGFSFEEF